MAGNKFKITAAVLLPEGICMLLASLCILAVNLTDMTKHLFPDILSRIVLAVLGIAALGFCLRKESLDESVSDDSVKHGRRFWICFALGLCVACVCIFLPEAAWPFLPVYIMLELFGSARLGVVGATLLLGITVSQTGADNAVFMMYLVSGLIGVTLFGKLKSGFQAGLPLLLSLLGLLVCETAGTVLVANARPSVESFVLPAANLFVCGIMILALLKYFSDKILYRYRENYLDLNDPENEILGALREQDRRAYMKSIHTAYFCERIAARLGLDTDALKCAGYYHGMGERLALLRETYSFPPKAAAILEEYGDKKSPVRHKETAVLMASENIISAIMLLLERSPGREGDYDRVIDAVFARYQETEIFRECDITVRQLTTMRDIFKEEKLYYDFLH